MNKHLVAIPGHPPQPVPVLRPVRRVGLVDRAALHLGVALITWGRRPVRADPRHRFALSPEGVAVRRELDELRHRYLIWGSALSQLR